MTEQAPLSQPQARLLRLARWLDRINLTIGQTLAWLALAMVLVTFLVVVLRYAFDLGWISLQESVTYMHATLFMLGIAYTLGRNAHVRVDIFYSQRFSPRQRAWVDLLGTLLLLIPVCLFILFVSGDYVVESWKLHEGSREAGGLPGVWLLKTLILLMPLLLLIQAVVLVLRNGLFLAGCESALTSPTPPETTGGGAHG
ncbi:TRAP transporter small permease subunit [Rhabdochromatium marinum]|uniref:TRAP transporter small permease subunit n=1 Tax=Rhabdochromatium marinum TaxID=48729 RepID=UPI0019065B2E|nr:TRAP transporter small permease subunit [Rhabdochromatium marinum]MBK1647129.1 C4-dicarboxylate ABC transporter permease [Rhabdochromatium marinum]